MAKAKKETRSLTAKERYDILVQFKKNREAGHSNKAASDMLGIPFITLYTWIRDELWRDTRHTTPPLVLGKRGRPVESRKAADKPPKNFTPAKERKPYLKAAVKKDEEPTPTPVTLGKPIIVRTPNGCEVEFVDLNEARAFAQSYNS